MNVLRSVALLLGTTALTLAGCGQRNALVAPPPPEVTVAKPASEEVLDYLEFTGSTRAVEAVRIRARVMGYLKSIEFEDGANVKAGDLLFVIEPEPFEAALASTKANQQKAEAALTLAEANIERAQPLVARKAITDAEMDVMEASRATAAADVAAAKAAVRQAELNLGYTRIRAPISGRIGRHKVDVGNLVQAEATELTTLESYDPIHVYFSVSEGDVLQLMGMSRDGQIESLRENPPKLFLKLGDDGDFTHEGSVEFAEFGVDPATGTQMRRATFPNEDGALVPGLFVRLRMPVGNPKPQLLVNERAIASDQRGDYVLVVNKVAVSEEIKEVSETKVGDESKEAKENEEGKEKKVEYRVEYRPVKLGALVEGRYVIKDGVKAEDWIVVNGLQRARPGAEVTPQQTEQTARKQTPITTAATGGK
jgi:multidrug efflux system membrane fusion protein